MTWSVMVEREGGAPTITLPYGDDETLARKHAMRIATARRRGWKDVALCDHQGETICRLSLGDVKCARVEGSAPAQLDHQQLAAGAGAEARE